MSLAVFLDECYASAAARVCKTICPKEINKASRNKNWQQKGRELR
jgi:hypothetical protein